MLNGKSNLWNRLVFAFIIKIEAEKLDGKSLKRLNILYEKLNHRLLTQNGMYTFIYADSVRHNFFLELFHAGSHLQKFVTFLEYLNFKCKFSRL